MTSTNNLDYQKKFWDCTQNVQEALVKGLQNNLDSSLTSEDQMGCTLIALTNLIRDLVGVIASGTEKEFTFETFIVMLNEMNQGIEKDAE